MRDTGGSWIPEGKGITKKKRQKRDKKERQKEREKNKDSERYRKRNIDSRYAQALLQDISG